MPVYSLSPFIKICMSDTGEQISDVQKKINSSDGYDYYRTLKSAIKGHIAGLEPEDISMILESGSSPAERSYNTSAYNVFVSKFGKSKSISTVQMPKKHEFFKSGIEIIFDPLFSIETTKGISTYSIWANKSPALSQKYGAVACYLQREAYKNTALSNSTFFFVDLTKGNAYSEKQITNNTSAIARSDFRKIADLFAHYDI